MKRPISTLLVSSVLGVSTLALPAHAAVIDQVKAKVDAIKTDTNTLKTRTSNIAASTNALIAKVDSMSELSEVVEGVVSPDRMNAIIDSVQPILEIVDNQRQEYLAFPSEPFRADLYNSVAAIFALPQAISGRENEQAAQVLDKIDAAHPFFLYAMSKTPVARLLDVTTPLADELLDIAAFAQAARAHVSVNFPDEAARMAAVGLTVAAPAFVSCEFVLENVSETQLSKMQLSQMRVSQIDRLLELVNELLPDDQTVGVTAVGGATVSVPNPAKPIITTLLEVTGKYTEFTGKWIDKVESCQPNELEIRLDQFLTSQGF